MALRSGAPGWLWPAVAQLSPPVDLGHRKRPKTPDAVINSRAGRNHGSPVRGDWTVYGAAPLAGPDRLRTPSVPHFHTTSLEQMFEHVVNHASEEGRT